MLEVMSYKKTANYLKDSRGSALKNKEWVQIKIKSHLGALDKDDEDCYIWYSLAFLQNSINEARFTIACFRYALKFSSPHNIKNEKIIHINSLNAIRYFLNQNLKLSVPAIKEKS